MNQFFLCPLSDHHQIRAKSV